MLLSKERLSDLSTISGDSLYPAIQSTTEIIRSSKIPEKDLINVLIVTDAGFHEFYSTETVKLPNDNVTKSLMNAHPHIKLSFNCINCGFPFPIPPAVYKLIKKPPSFSAIKSSHLKELLDVSSGEELVYSLLPMMNPSERNFITSIDGAPISRLIKERTFRALIQGRKMTDLFEPFTDTQELVQKTGGTFYQTSLK